MKKKIVISLSLVCVLALGFLVKGMSIKANSADVSVTVDQTVKKEAEFNVAVSYSSDMNLQVVDSYIYYDDEVLEFIGADSEAVAGTSGVVRIIDEFEEGANGASYNLTFKAIALGDTSIRIEETYMEEFETLSVIQVADRSIALEVVENKSESQEARLSDILIYPGELDQEFDPNVFEYTATVDYEDEIAFITAEPIEEDSVVTLEQDEFLSYGENVVLIEVTAPSGGVSVYKVTVVRPSEPQEDESETDETDEDESDTVETDETEPETVDETDDVNSDESESETDDTTENSSAQGIDIRIDELTNPLDDGVAQGE